MSLAIIVRISISFSVAFGSIRSVILTVFPTYTASFIDNFQTIDFVHDSKVVYTMGILPH